MQKDRRGNLRSALASNYDTGSCVCIVFLTSFICASALNMRSSTSEASLVSRPRSFNRWRCSSCSTIRDRIAAMRSSTLLVRWAMLTDRCRCEIGSHAQLCSRGRWYPRACGLDVHDSGCVIETARPIADVPTREWVAEIERARHPRFGGGHSAASGALEVQVQETSHRHDGSRLVLIVDPHGSMRSRTTGCPPSPALLNARPALCLGYKAANG